MRKTSLEIEQMMRALGCGIRSEAALTPENCDPEKQILKSLKYYWENNSVFFLIYTSLLKRLHPFIHVDRLVKLAKNSIISNDELCLLVAICNNLSKIDTRYELAARKLSSKNLKMQQPPKNETEAFLVKEWGAEHSLKPFGVTARAFIIVKNGKLAPLQQTFDINPWFKYRALFGPNTRADCAFILYTAQEDLTASEVARRAFTSRQAIGKHYKDLSMLKGAFNLAG